MKSMVQNMSSSLLLTTSLWLLLFLDSHLIKIEANITLRSIPPLSLMKRDTPRIRRNRNTAAWSNVILHATTNEDVCPYINLILNQRLEQVLNGERKKHFARYYKSSRLKIVSTHGRNTADKVDATEGPSIIVPPSDKSSSEAGSPTWSSNEHNYPVFPKDTKSLDLSLTSELYECASDEIAKRKESESMEDDKYYSTMKSLYGPKLFFRAMRLCINFAPITMSCGLAAMSERFRDNYWYDMLGSCLARSGPAFIKWGQWASTRSDMFPDRFCVALSQLHADAPAHSWKITKDTVEEALCIPKNSIHDIFDSFDQEPVASGSIAQIHRATIKPSLCQRDSDGEQKGALVAIKVRHPNVKILIDMDFRLMSILATAIDFFPALRWLRIKSSIEQFSHTMAAQAHLNVEAHHLEVLNYNFRNWDNVDFPRPIFACPQVIIETFEEGKICSTVIDQYDRLASEISLTAGDVMPVPLAKFIVTTGLALYLKMLIIDNMMHADLHPGNIMILAQLFDQRDAISSVLNPSDELSGKHTMRMARAEVNGFYGHITLVDAGMVAQLEEDESVNFINLMSSLGAGDGTTAAEAVLKFSDDRDYLTEEEQELFTQDMISYFDEHCRGYGTGVDVGEVLRGILNLIKNHHVRVDANYATLVVNALCIEGLAKRVCPSYNVLDAAKPLLNSYRTVPLFKSKSLKVSLLFSIESLLCSNPLVFLFTYKHKAFSNEIYFFHFFFSSRNSC